LRSRLGQLGAKRRALLALPVLGALLLLRAGGAPSAGSAQHGFLDRGAAAPGPATSVLPSGFSDEVAFSGLTNPTSIRFAPDGRVFVAEKSGLVEVFDSLEDTTPTVVVDLRNQVDDFWDRGLLGMTLDPNFATSPYVYLLFTYDAPPGGTAPVWNDACPAPPGATTDGCVVTGKLVRVHLSGDTADAPPQTLISNQWCQQYPSHSVGDLRFGPDGKLYATAGEGASFEWVDYGQGGGSPGSPTPKNPCGDPPAGAGGNETPPTAQGGSLRSQSPRRPSGPTLLNGSLLRLDPGTGDAPADNPNTNPTDANLRRIIAYGLRNPFRFVFRPGTNPSQIWIGDVGMDTWEEIDRRNTPTGAVQNFGWPCYEGANAQPGWQSAGVNICSALYGTPSLVTAPYYAYSHFGQVAPGDNCPTANGSVISGMAFYEGSNYPASYDGALVFADHSRNCIWTMGLGTNGDPDPTKLQALVEGAANPVDIETGPNGDLYYVDFDGGTIHHIAYSAVPGCPANTFTAQYFNNMSLSGQPVLTRCENTIDNNWGANSPAPEVNPDNFSARWTQDVTFADGTYTFTATADDGIRVYVDGAPVIDEWHDVAAATPYTSNPVPLAGGIHHIRVEYYEDTGAAEAQVGWELTGPPPDAVIDTPNPVPQYAVGDQIPFSGHATDQDGAMPASELSWTLLIHHCTTAGCHVHNVQTWTGTDHGSFPAPDHPYPSHLELVLHATNAQHVTGTTSITLNPRTVALSLHTEPSGLKLALNAASTSAPFVSTVIVNSQSSISAPVTQTVGGRVFHFVSWSDGGAATHNVTAPASPRTYTATYREELPAPPSATSAPTLSGTAQQGKTLRATAGTWTGATALAYAWLRCNRNGASCVRIAGAAGSSYTLTGFDVGSRVLAQVTGTNAGGSSSARSSASAVVKRLVRVVTRVFPRQHVRARPHKGH
jgi:glucose/arabinose dehydrogenase